MEELNVNDLNYLFTCTKCKNVKKNYEFKSLHNSKNRIRKYSARCKSCLKEIHNEWSKNNKESRNRASKNG